MEKKIDPNIIFNRTAIRTNVPKKTTPNVSRTDQSTILVPVFVPRPRLYPDPEDRDLKWTEMFMVKWWELGTRNCKEWER
ncbi:hypothetical protein CCACVL1_07958 [Corchorus capsularis]|uniref:Uncharacterized protein n=1 Tax=Corchorus capsularis TaxID=210143 RepID=A0A1R3J374_COCAP|nr:hypothetical protein CCACVL1_07958 [Corchorus capsularis]